MASTSKIIGFEEYRQMQLEKAEKAAKKSDKKSSKRFDDDLDEALEQGTGIYDTSNWFGKPAGKGKGKGAVGPRCYSTHKPLPIGDYLIYGGSCSAPVVLDADIYVGFEHGMMVSTKAYPWSTGDSFYFPIVDGSVPKNLEDTHKLLEYLSTNLKAGKKIHIGCIGGHGRTGTIMAALVTHMTGNKDSINYVRTHYCNKAVESTTQIEWLHKNFGITKVKPSKSVYDGNTSFGFHGKGTTGVSKNYSDHFSTRAAASKAEYTFVESVKPVRVKGNIFGF